MNTKIITLVVIFMLTGLSLSAQNNSEKGNNYVDIGIAGIDHQGNHMYGQNYFSFGYPYSFFVKIVNYGNIPVDSIDLKLSTYYGNITFNEKWTGNLDVGDTIEYEFNNQITAPLGWFEVCIEVFHPKDTIIINDTLCEEYIGAVGNSVEENAIQIEDNFPNPCDESTTIPFWLDDSGELTVLVTEITGKLIYSEQTFKAPGKHRLLLNTKDYKPGVYICSFRINDSVLQRKILVK
ncbi:MAG: T9SS type A sorting domain-containing protein [Bacteroidales bacterium]